jgi:hypothetical protein
MKPVDFDARGVLVSTLPKGTRFVDIQGGVATLGDEHGAHRGVFKATGTDGHETCYAGCAKVVPLEVEVR